MATTRNESVPVATNPGGTIAPRRRAAAVKLAIRDYTASETIKITATWNKTTQEWDLVFKDE